MTNEFPPRRLQRFDAARLCPDRPIDISRRKIDSWRRHTYCLFG
jgi:hypothetical protein